MAPVSNGNSRTLADVAYPVSDLYLIPHLCDLLLSGLDLALELLDLVVQHKLELLKLLYIAGRTSIAVNVRRVYSTS